MENTASQQLKAQQQQLTETTLGTLFKQDNQRAQRFFLSVGELHFDYSKNFITDKVINSLAALAAEKNLAPAISSLFAGEKVNNTEQRAALHSALRAPANHSAISQLVQGALDKMEVFIEKLHQRTWLGFNNKPIETVINIGIGGSDLGPRMVTQALSAYHHTSVNVLFVANIDGADLEDTLRRLNPDTTLFIVASKTFTTLETLHNALSAREWVQNAGCTKEDLHKHFVGISANIDAAKTFGIAEENIFPMWDWVGGRYSLWSAIGLPVAAAIGMSHFRDLLAGAHLMDDHFKSAPFEQNMPVLAALLSYWYSHFWGVTSQAVLPYAQRLSRLPAYLQQLDMESLGKRATKQGDAVAYPTGLVIWGTEGTNGQHSFHQLLHQGTQLVPVDFIAVKAPMSHYGDQHRQLLACCISQAQALLQGKTLAEAQNELKAQGLSDAEVATLAPHKVIPGNKPSNMLIMDKLSPANLGTLIAFYENKVYASSILLNINAFDQWGVELGKQLGKPIYTALLTGESDTSWDGSTLTLIEKMKR
jgi:glucose-6-phosphate isomerase